MKKSVIIDCDPGVDDAIALLIGFMAEELDIRAITTVAGNLGIDKTTGNALKLVEAAGKNIRVASGARFPISKSLETAENIHGEFGIGDVSLRYSKQRACDKDAVETIYEEAVALDGKLNLITLAPLTNIGELLVKHPDVSCKIDNIIIMGGSSKEGNHTPSAEFNIFSDPDAAKIVLDAGIPVLMIGLDVTKKAIVKEEEIDDLLPLNEEMSKIIGGLFRWALRVSRSFGSEGAVMHDPFALCCAIDPDIVTTKDCHVDIIIDEGENRGKTIVNFEGVGSETLNAKFGIAIDRKKFLNLIKGILKRY